MKRTQDLITGPSHDVRASPFYCPYCGEEDLRPVPEPPGAWRCADCRRTFAVTLASIGVPAVRGGRARREELRTLALRARHELIGATTEDVLAWTAQTFGDRFVVASNMQDAVLVDLASHARPGVDVLFLDTGYHFAETIGARDAIAAAYPVRIVDARPAQSVAEQDATEGRNLFARDPDRCCHLRKVVPLQAVLAGYDAWVTGLRRVDAPSRADIPLLTWDSRHGLVKVNPLAAWTDEEMAAYVEAHGVLVNPLVAAGYPSIGCAPCTARPAPGADPRSGRWAGTAKTECGLHG